ncbi:MAG: MarR family transcriptional regulator [Pseudomonadota bacterium]
MTDEAILALQIDRLMRRFHSNLHPRAERIDKEKIGPVGGMILIVISESGPTTAQLIGSTLGRDKSQVSRLLNLLVKKGLVEKSTNDIDARRLEIRLTEKGLLQVAAFNGALIEATKTILGNLNKDEARQFSNLLSKIMAQHSV